MLALAGLAILLSSELVLARLTTCVYHVDGQLDGARYLSRARFTSKIDHVTNRLELGGGSGGLGPVVGSFWGFGGSGFVSGDRESASGGFGSSR